MKKFNIGDRVRFTARLTQYQNVNLRKRTRTIRRTFYDAGKRCTFYVLSDVGKGELGLYRSYELKLAENISKRGRPKLRKRGRPKLKR